MNTMRIKKRVTRFFKASRAVSALEYAILVGVVVVAIGAALAVFTDQVTNALNAAGTSISSVPGLGGGATG